MVRSFVGDLGTYFLLDINKAVRKQIFGNLALVIKARISQEGLNRIIEILRVREHNSSRMGIQMNAS